MIGTKILSEKTVSQAKLFDIVESQILVPGGKTRKHKNIILRHTVVVFPIEGSDIYLIEQYRYLLQKTNIEAVSGFIEQGETSIQAAKRELQEEIGFIAAQWEEIGRIELSASVIRSVVHLFLAQDLEKGDPNREPGEEIAVVKMPFSEAVEKVQSGQINATATMNGILLLDKLNMSKHKK